MEDIIWVKIKKGQRKIRRKVELSWKNYLIA